MRSLMLAMRTLLLCALPLSCASPNSDDPGANGVPFIAFKSNFENYRTWESFKLPDGSSDIVHLAGPKTEYLNKRPVKGAKSFPVGTIIVKELEVGDFAARKVFAMVKRGAGFNSSGAKDWEWYELSNTADGNVAAIRWHGVGPPLGEMYGGDPSGGCNSCHSAGASNDSVLSAVLQLSGL
jgi:hypothetical protein